MSQTIPSESPKKGLPFNRVLPVFFLTFVDILGLTVILPLLHLYSAQYGATPLQIGLVAGAFPLAQLLGVPIMGALSDRYGRKPLLLISQVTTFVSFLMLGMAQSLEVIVLSRLLDGLFGANIATAQAALSDITDEDNRAQALGLIGAAFGLGFIFGPITSLIALEISNSLAVPAFTAAIYSFLSICLTLFAFKETLPSEKRGQNKTSITNFFVVGRMLRVKGASMLLLLVFAEQLVFFGFETLMGVFTLSRLGLLGQGNALYFLVIGVLLVGVQVRFIGKWTRQYGERKVIIGALALLSIGLLMVAFTPEQPHPFYVLQRAEYELRGQDINSTEAIIGEINVPLPPDDRNGIGGIVWFLIAIVPLSIGAGLIRPSVNSLLTKRVGKEDYGSILGVSASFVSGANAIAPLLAGALIQQYGTSTPFLLGGIWMAFLVVFSVRFLPR